MGAANKLYNGNIAETFWRTATDGGFVRNYGYKYDQLNRLKDATYQKSGQLTNMYNENLTYDKNGNIMNLSRYGDRDEQYLPIQIDNLGYNYGTNSNQLKSVTDATNNTSGFKDGNTTGDDYVYDGNGNMTVDKNKNITAITYNHLNLPTKIIFTTGNIMYIYTASGQKMQKIVTDGTNTTTTDYLGGYQYQNTVLQFFPTAEGYVKNTPISGTNTYSYVFNYTDHLGNTRLSYTKDTTGSLKILEENNFYPFGLKHSPYNAIAPAPEYKYKYNGKELQDELGLNMYDYGARNYDPALGRWMNIDPLAEKSRRLSTYAYCYNNPLIFTDPDGMLATPPTDLFNMSGKKNGTDGVNNGAKIVVTDKAEAKQIAKTKGNIDLSTVKSGVSLPSDTALKESINVLDRTIANGGMKEEVSMVMKDGNVIQGQTGPMPTITNNVQTAPSALPSLPAGATVADVETTIHSHPTEVQQVGNMIYPQSASSPSTGPNTDQTTFQQFGTNIIVGPLGTVNPNNVTVNPNGTLNIPSRPQGAAIYDSNSNLKVELPRRAIENILK